MSEEEWQAAAPTIPYRTQAALARNRGYAESHDEVIAGVSSIAAPITVPGGKPAAVAVVYIRSDQDAAKIGAELSAGAERIASQLR
jgi:DNA-binding IclR family transcriptional regulator